jgi:hypothetical protein
LELHAEGLKVPSIMAQLERDRAEWKMSTHAIHKVIVREGKLRPTI